jgi:hypothetical protein
MAETSEELAIRSALAAMTATQPPPPPARYSAVTRRVAVNRRRRIASVALAVAILAAAAIAIPLGWLHTGPPPPPSAPRYHVTILPPPHGSPTRVVAVGRINGLRWQAEVTWTKSKGWCQSVAFDRETVSGCGGGPPPTMGQHANPVANLQPVGTQTQVDIATVRDDVTRVQIAYTNGSVLTARPHAVFGPADARYIAFPAPYDAAVIRITAFSKHGPIAYAIPFTASIDAGITLERWLRPGQPALPEAARYLAGTGVSQGRRWRDEVYVGPWGTCFVHPEDVDGSSAVNCFPSVGWLQGRPKVAVLIGVAYQGNGGFVYGQAEPAVRYLIVTTAHGHTGRVLARSAGSRRFFVFFSKNADAAARWTAYDAAGHELGSGAVFTG